MEESAVEEGPTGSTLQRHGTAFTEEDVEESVARLGESTWEGSPRKGLSRENSAAAETEDGPGVVKMMQQFQQIAMNNRTGGVRGTEVMINVEQQMSVDAKAIPHFSSSSDDAFPTPSTEMKHSFA